MCVGVPSRIVSIDGELAFIDVGGVQRQVSLMLLDEAVELGDHVLVHAGFAIRRLDPEEARLSLALFDEILRRQSTAD